MRYLIAVMSGTLVKVLPLDGSRASVEYFHALGGGCFGLGVKLWNTPLRLDGICTLTLVK